MGDGMPDPAEKMAVHDRAWTTTEDAPGRGQCHGAAVPAWGMELMCAGVGTCMDVGVPSGYSTAGKAQRRRSMGASGWLWDMAVG